jgi:methionyl-tRNA formyltransferase
LVISQPDRPQGRGRKTIPTPVKQTALELGLNVIQPVSVNQDDVIETISALNPDFFVVVAFGQLIARRLLAVPKFAPINIHASLLPAYRGAAPIQHAIINGDSKTGITTMLMDVGMDSGDMLLTAETDITSEDTSGTLHDRLSEIGASLIVKTLDMYLANELKPRSQDPENVSYAPMLSKTDGRIDWTKPAVSIHCRVRGMTPWPGAFTFFQEKRFKLISVAPIDTDSGMPPGTLVECSNGRLVIQTGKGSLSVVEIQGDSGKRLSVGDFLRGSSLKTGDMFL